jgi:hypothetical protein
MQLDGGNQLRSHCLLEGFARFQHEVGPTIVDEASLF